MTIAAFRSKILLVVFLFFTGIPAFSQDILRGNDLSNIKVDRLSDADILKYQQQLKNYGLTQDEAEQIALAKGFPPSELAKLRQRLALISSQNVTDNKSDNRNFTEESIK